MRVSLACHCRKAARGAHGIQRVTVARSECRGYCEPSKGGVFSQQVRACTFVQQTSRVIARDGVCRLTVSRDRHVINSRCHTWFYTVIHRSIKL